MALKKAEQVIELKPMNIVVTEITIVGDTPLIVHSWAEKALREMRDNHRQTAKTKAKAPQNPYEDFIESMYWITPKPKEFTLEAFEDAVRNGARWGTPVTGIKQSAISGAFRSGVLKDMASTRGAFFIDGIQIGNNQLAEIISDTPIMREDLVRIGMGKPDLRYREEYRNWRINLTVRFNANGKYTLEQIVNIINIGGFTTGIGEWRPERDGQYGMFHVEGA